MGRLGDTLTQQALTALFTKKNYSLASQKLVLLTQFQNEDIAYFGKLLFQMLIAQFSRKCQHEWQISSKARKVIESCSLNNSHSAAPPGP